jgi:hypothetical protein
MKFRIPFFVFAFIICPFQGIFSQSIQNEVLASAGDSYYLESVEVSWTLGESIIGSYQSGDILVSQGFHQPLDGFVEIPEQLPTVFQASVFPNPTNRYIQIELDGSSETEIFQITLSDIMGKVLFHQTFKPGTQNAIDLDEFSGGILLLKIIRETDSSQRTFKVVKTSY